MVFPKDAYCGFNGKGVRMADGYKALVEEIGSLFNSFNRTSDDIAEKLGDKDDESVRSFRAQAQSGLMMLLVGASLGSFSMSEEAFGDVSDDEARMFFAEKLSGYSMAGQMLLDSCYAAGSVQEYMEKLDEAAGCVDELRGIISLASREELEELEGMMIDSSKKKRRGGSEAGGGTLSALEKAKGKGRKGD